MLEPIQRMAAGDIMILVAAMDMGSDYNSTHCLNGYMLLEINTSRLQFVQLFRMLN